MRLIFLVLLINYSYSQNSDFDEANILYNEGRYIDAIDVYNKILDSGLHSSDLYFNIGNSYYKINDTPNSIFYYEKALLLKPDNESVKNNLAYAQNMLIDKIETLPKNQITVLFDSILSIFSYEYWQFLTIFFQLLLVSFSILFFISKTSILKKRYFKYSSISLFIFTVTLIMSINSKSKYLESDPAILYDKEVSFRSEPNLRSEEIFKLHEGLKINVKENINDWTLVQLSNGSEGWVPTSSFRKIK
tara:strand:- start:392 stop:1132 length:741 start_codon:yes stop_codon:yes gene_type:complete